ncbi:MAG: hypothetical protein V4717_22170 [Bacteroidota bacterium]
MPSTRLIAIFIVIILPGFVLGQDTVSNLLSREMINVLQQDGLLLSKKIQLQDQNELWNSEKKKKKVIENFDDFFNKIKNKLEPAQCTNKGLYNNLVIDGESFYSIVNRVFENGIIDKDLGNRLADFNIPVKYNAGVPILNLSENSFFTFTSSSVIGLNSQNKVDLNVDSRVLARINAYRNDSISNSKAFELNYICGSFQNHLADLADSIIEQKIFSDYDISLVKEFWDNSSKRRPTDSLVRYFKGVYLQTRQGAFSSNQTAMEARLKSNVGLGFVNASTNTSINRQNNRSNQSSNENYKLYIISKPVMQAIPTRAQIKEAFKNVLSLNTAVITKDIYLNNNNTELIDMQVGPISGDMYKMIKIDHDFIRNHLPKKYGNVFTSSLIYSDTADNEARVRNLKIALQVDNDFKSQASSGFAKGEKFNLPMRLYYRNIKVGNDTLFIYESTKDLTAKFSNFPITEDNAEFKLIDSTSTAYQYHTSIRVTTEGEQIFDSPNIIQKYANVSQEMINMLHIDPMLFTNLGASLGSASKRNGEWYYDIDLAVPKNRINKLSADLTLPFEINVIYKNQHEPASKRIVTLTIPVPKATNAGI